MILPCRIDLAHDVFGRERHRLHKDDMGGVGTFDKECRTLYVGGLAHRTKLEKLLWTEFGEWGEIEVNSIHIDCIRKIRIFFMLSIQIFCYPASKLLGSGTGLGNGKGVGG